MNMAPHVSSKTVEWYTPPDLFSELNREFGFTLDPCATAENAVCKRFFTAETDGLMQSWIGERVFMNPPYGREIGPWIKKAASGEADIVVCLLPARTDTAWWHDQVIPFAKIVRYIRGRLRFGGHKHNCPCPCAIVVFEKAAA